MAVTQLGGGLGNGDTVRYKTYTWLDGQVAITQVHFLHFIAGVNDVRLGEMAQNYMAQTETPYQACLGAGVLYMGVKAEIVKGDTTALPGIAVLNTVITEGNAPDKPWIGGLLKYLSQTKGARGRGRNYIPFPQATSIGPTGLCSQPYIDQMQALGLVNRIWPQNVIRGATITNQQVLFSTTDNLTRPVTEATAETQAATQRRRSVRGAQNPPVIS